MRGNQYNYIKDNIEGWLKIWTKTNIIWSNAGWVTTGIIKYWKRYYIHIACITNVNYVGIIKCLVERNIYFMTKIFKQISIIPVINDIIILYPFL